MYMYIIKSYSHTKSHHIRYIITKQNPTTPFFGETFRHTDAQLP